MGSLIFNITFDCVDPEVVASFWSQVTGYQRLALDSAELDDDVVALESPASRGARLLSFNVPEPKTMKNRVHIDLASNHPKQRSSVWSGDPGPLPRAQRRRDHPDHTHSRQPR